jgi:membrane protein implicated in regulation of membrane protease activity
MRGAALAGLALVCLWSALAILQLWFAVVSGETFFKLTATAGILLALIVVAALVTREYVREADLKNKEYLD